MALAVRPSRGAGTELFTGGLAHIGAMQRKTRSTHGGPMDASVPTPSEPAWLKTAAGPGRCAQDAADALEVFCSDSLRSIDRTVMRAQVIELILDILATTDVQSEARRRLLQHLATISGVPRAGAAVPPERERLPAAGNRRRLPRGGRLPSGGRGLLSGCCRGRAGGKRREPSGRSQAQVAAGAAAEPAAARLIWTCR